MKNNPFNRIKIAILTISDGCSRGEREDKSGQFIREKIQRLYGEIVKYEIIPDEIEIIKQKLIGYCEEMEAAIILTCGGTGVSPRDVTPEATSQVIDKEIPGIPEAIRIEGLKKTKRAILSRAKAGVRGQTLIINLPGSRRAVEESLDVILDILPHTLDMIKGKGHDEI